MNKTIKIFAIAALFCFPGLSGFPQEVQQEEAPNAYTAQEAEGNINWPFGIVL